MQLKKLRKLLNELTVTEKVGQLIQLSGEFFESSNDIVVGPEQKLGISPKIVNLSGSVLNVAGAKKTREIQDRYMAKSKHHIPLLFMADIIYGYKTIYPIPLGLGATWNTKLIRDAYKNTASEAKASGVQVAFAPMVDLVRDPRWGRVLESTGEDPYLNSQFSSSMVEGLQNGLNEGHGMASCIKHFAAYGAAESGKEYNTTDMSEYRLRNQYLPSYKAAVDSGVKMVMTSFNSLNGVPATANEWLMKKVLREEWGFEGVLISDYAAVSELVAHGIAEDNRMATQQALKATVDIDMKSPCYVNELEPLLENGSISEEKVNEAVWRVLKLKNDLGLFEDPYRGASEQAERHELVSQKRRELARKVADRAMVLLKNQNNILPLNKNQKIALIGPYADSQELIGLWTVHGNTKDVISISQAFREHATKQNLRIAEGTNILENKEILNNTGISSDEQKSFVLTHEEEFKKNQEAIEAAKDADVVMVLGEHTLESGEAGSKTNLTLPDNQLKLLEKIRSLNKKIVLVVISGRPLVLSNIEPQVDAIIQAWFPGTEGGHAVADVIFGEFNPSGRLSMSFPYLVGQLPIYYNHFSTGRSPETSKHSTRYTAKYIDTPVKPLYPFGFGLSYHHAIYSNLRLNKKTMNKEDNIKVSVDIQNDSEVAGEETVQLYIRDVVGSIVRPVKELKSFKKVALPANSTITVSFEVTNDMLKFYGRDLNYESEPGNFEIFGEYKIVCVNE
ncbi:beta-glucosidase BglX [Pediococcus ethanolidurans]